MGVTDTFMVILISISGVYKCLWLYVGEQGLYEMLEFECKVEKDEALRVPGINRYYMVCGDVEIVVELPKHIYRLNVGDIVSLNILEDRDECLKNDFCGQGHVVTSSRIDDIHRIILSIGGLLVIIKAKPGMEFIDKLRVVEKYYVGIKRLTK